MTSPRPWALVLIRTAFCRTRSLQQLCSLSSFQLSTRSYLRSNFSCKMPLLLLHWGCSIRWRSRFRCHCSHWPSRASTVARPPRGEPSPQDPLGPCLLQPLALHFLAVSGGAAPWYTRRRPQTPGKAPPGGGIGGQVGNRLQRGGQHPVARVAGNGAQPCSFPWPALTG